MKKKKSPSTAAKKLKAAPAAQPLYPDADPEWEHLEERYSQIGSEMRSLAKMLNVGGDGSGAGGSGFDEQ